MPETIQPHILVVDDDPQIRDLLQDYLTQNDLRVSVNSTGQEMSATLAEHTIDLVVLDLRLSGEDGMTLARKLREESAIPVIILTGVRDEADRIMGLELGADDYLTKPFSPRELLARVQAAIRRSKRTKVRPTVAFGDVRVDFVRMQATRKGDLVTLTAHEFKLLRFFLDNPERVLSREELLNEVWGYNSYPSTRTVDNQILKLRQKLEGNPAEPVHFCTVHGAGYRFVPMPVG
jgi:DNA-binding response OmpR family regulator